MRRTICSLTLVLALAGLAAASALAAGGKGSQTLTATCTTSGGVTVHASSGQSAWVNNTHWIVLTIHGEFTPTGGTTVKFDKRYGNKTGFPVTMRQTCTGSTSDSTGMFSFTVLVGKTPHH